MACAPERAGKMRAAASLPQTTAPRALCLGEWEVTSAGKRPHEGKGPEQDAQRIPSLQGSRGTGDLGEQPPPSPNPVYPLRTQSRETPSALASGPAARPGRFVPFVLPREGWTPRFASPGSAGSRR